MLIPSTRLTGITPIKELQDPAWLEPANLPYGYPVVAMDMNIQSKLQKHLVEIVGERVAVIDEQEPIHSAN